MSKLVSPNTIDLQSLRNKDEDKGMATNRQINVCVHGNLREKVRLGFIVQVTLWGLPSIP